VPATLMQLRRLVRSRLGIPVADDFMPDHVIDDHVNLAIQAIESEFRWPWSDAGHPAESAVAGHPWRVHGRGRAGARGAG
jgi:hypothetical protein